MHIASRALDDSSLYSPAFEPVEPSFATSANAFSSAFGCASSWTNGCAGHHYHSWNDPTLQAPAFGPSSDKGMGTHGLAIGAASPGERSLRRKAQTLALRLLGRRTKG